MKQYFPFAGPQGAGDKLGLAAGESAAARMGSSVGIGAGFETPRRLYRASKRGRIRNCSAALKVRQ